MKHFRKEQKEECISGAGAFRSIPLRLRIPTGCRKSLTRRNPHPGRLRRKASPTLPITQARGFGLIKSLKAGDTFFVIKDGEKHTYRCVSYYGDAYRDSEGHGFLPDGRDYVDDGDTAIVTQTCNDATGNSVTVQYWVEE